MPWPVHPNGLLGAQGDNDTYQISRSLRFNSADSAYLSRTFGTPTNQNVWTLSVWLKGSDFSSSSIFGASSSGVTNFEAIYFDSLSNLRAETYINLPPIQSRNQKTNAVFRDTSAWYHFVVAKNGSWASSYPYTIYVNGISQSVTTFDLNTSFVNRLNSNGVTHQIGADGVTTGLFNGYMAEFQFIDGQALTPSSFGETDAVTGRWKAKAYSGSYGTNGFYLKFADNSSTAALGTDSSGNGNTWTVNNFSITAGAGNDSLVDSPTNYGSDTGVGGTVRGNYATLNPLHYNYDGVDLRNGNLDGYGVLTTTTPSARTYPSTIKIKSGKWYVELTVNATSNGHVLGIANTFDSYGNISYSDGYGYNFWDQIYLSSGGSLSYGVRATAGQVVGMAVDLDNGKLEWFVNGSSQGQKTGIISGEYFIAYYLARGTAGTVQSGSINFGQRPFAYAAPSGFKALCTTNLSTPTIKKPSTAMDVVTYTGNGGTQTISSLGFSPDLVWVKGRSQVSANHILTDRVRGNGASLMSNNTNAEGTRGATLTSNGFSFTYPDEGGDANFSAATYVAWAWDEAPIAGMDIVSYTGNGANRTIAHNLGVAPKFVIVKRRDTGSSPWMIWHNNLTSGTYYLSFATTAEQSGPTRFTASPTSSAINVGTDSDLNANGGTYIAYCFAEIEGFSKFGSYTGTGTTDGAFVWCGFRPRCVMYKRTDSTENWVILDSARDTFNVSGGQLILNSSSAEGTGSSNIDIVSNGFKMRSATAGGNVNNGTYIFAAFAEQPFKYARAR